MSERDNRNTKMIHDETVNNLHQGLVAVLQAGSEYTVHTRINWQPNEDFPNEVYTFDIAIASSDSAVHVENGQLYLSPRACVVTVIDVVTKDDYETEFYDKPDTLVLSCVDEYCIFDPTAEVLRPPFQAYRKVEAVWQIRRSTKHGVFFSVCRFRLEVSGTFLAVSECGCPMDEEDLFDCQNRLEFALARKEPNQKEIVGLTTKIKRLEARILGERKEQ